MRESARVMRVVGNGLVVLVAIYGVEDVVHVGDGEGIVDKVDGCIRLTKSRRIFRVFGVLEVRVRRECGHERMDQVVYKLVRE